jgi:hypothetical protein
MQTAFIVDARQEYLCSQRYHASIEFAIEITEFSFVEDKLPRAYPPSPSLISDFKMLTF